MEYRLIIEKVIVIVSNYITAEKIEMDTPLTSKPYYLDARSIAAIFTDIEREFAADLNKVFDQPMDYSVGAIAGAIEAQL